MIRGWVGYFDQGPVVRVYRASSSTPNGASDDG